MNNYSFLFFLIIPLISCASQKNVLGENQEKKSDTIELVNVPIVEKPFYNKIGEKSDKTEFYIRCSVQDYFIKFCESQVTKEQLESALSKIESPIKTLSVKIEIREGEWDRCDSNQVQSRIGKYVVLHSIE